MNKEVCKQCYRRYPKSWDANQDRDWSGGYVVCPVGSTPDWWNMKGYEAEFMDYAPPPEWCLMQLEQLVMDHNPC